MIMATRASVQAKSNSAMTELRKPDLPAAWPRRVSEELASIDSLPNGHGKDIIQKSCTSCHDAARIAANRDDEVTPSWMSVNACRSSN